MSAAPKVTALPRGMHKVAYELARLGFRVFPLRHQGKIPAWKNWKTRATNDPIAVLDTWPSDHHAPGIATGADYTVIDIEAAGLGVDNVALQLPHTLTVASPRGGKHYYFKTPPGMEFGCSVKRIAPNTDVRGVGGLVAGPGATFRDPETGSLGEYKVCDTSPAVELPAHLIEKMRAAPVRVATQGQVVGDLDAPHSVKRALEYLASDGKPPFHGPGRNIMPGNRGTATYAAAARLGDFGISRDKAKELLEVWNKQCCTPPQEAEEFEASVDHSYDYRLNAIGCDNALAPFGEVQTYCAPLPQAPHNLNVVGQMLWQAGATFRAGMDAQAQATQRKTPEAPHADAQANGPDPFTGQVSTQEAHQVALPALIRVSDLAGKAIPPREWHAPGIPAKNVTGLFGDGATGKSLLGAQLGVATVLAKTWINRTVMRPGAVIFISCEDDADELHRRFAAIAAKYGASVEDLKDLHQLALAGEDAVLGAAGRNEIVQPTQLWKRVSEMILDVKPTLVVYDTLADLFAGNENSRNQARQFVGQLRKPAILTGGSALLLAHPSLSGMASGTGSSGSTGWNNSVRSRMYFSRVQTQDGREADPDARVLRTMKANYGPAGDETRLYWEDGIFVPDSGKPARQRTARENLAEVVFLELLRSYNADGRNVSHSRSPTYAPAVFEKEPKAGDFTRKDFEAAMNRLFSKKLLRIEETGSTSRKRSRLICV